MASSTAQRSAAGDAPNAHPELAAEGTLVAQGELVEALTFQILPGRELSREEAEFIDNRIGAGRGRSADRDRIPAPGCARWIIVETAPETLKRYLLVEPPVGAEELLRARACPDLIGEAYPRLPLIGEALCQLPRSGR